MVSYVARTEKEEELFEILVKHNEEKVMGLNAKV